MSVQELEQKVQQLSPGELEEFLAWLETHKSELLLPEKPKTMWEMLDEIAGTIEGPSDLAAEHDHYLYGTPKRNPQAG